MTSVCFVAPFGLGQKTTVWARILPLARVLADRGYDVAILIPPWDTPADSDQAWTEDGVQLINVKIGGGTLLIVWRLLREIRQRQPDIVHIVKPRAHAGLVQWCLWQVRKAPLIWLFWRWRFHLFLDVDDWEQAWSEINQYGPVLARFLAWQEEWGIRHADGITAASKWLSQRAQTYAPQTPIHYLPNGVIDKASGTSPPVQVATNEKSILYFSRMIEVTPLWLAEFVHDLAKHVPQATLLIAGGGLNKARDRWFRTEFETCIERLRATADGTDQNILVEWLGLVSAEEIRSLYARATCAIFPAQDIPLQQAKCSVRLATTLLNGVPVIASAVGQQTEYGAEGAALLIEHDGQIEADPTLFSQAVATVLRQPKQQHNLIDAAQTHLRSAYNWPKLGDSLAVFYTEQ